MTSEDKPLELIVDIQGIKNQVIKEVMENLNRTKQEGKGIITESREVGDTWKKELAPHWGKNTYNTKIQEAINNVGSAIPEIWSNDIIMKEEQETVVVTSAAVDLDENLKGRPGDTLNYILISPMTAGNVAIDGTVTAGTTTLTGIPITLHENCLRQDCPKYVQEEAVPSLLDKINDKMAQAMAFKLDQDILGTIAQNSGLGGSTAHTAMTGSLIGNAIGTMLANTYKPAVLFIHPNN